MKTYTTNDAIIQFNEQGKDDNIEAEFRLKKLEIKESKKDSKL